MGEVCWFYRDEAEWIGIAEKLKLTACPHCKAVGNLIRHGALQGFDENGRIVLRAHRVYCSRRNRRRGCGRTVSVWLADKIKRLKVTTRRLWNFLQMAVAGAIESAIRALDSRLSDRTWQRIWARFKAAQSHLRTALAIRCALPEHPAQPSRRPAALTLAHLQAAFPNVECPIAAFHLTIKTFFL
jgi:hypothetical protein